MSVVLDASALLALIFEEPGAERVMSVLTGASITSVNAAEVMTRMIDRGFDLDQAGALWTASGLQVVVFDLDLATRAARLRVAGRAFGLSIGDRACLALAERSKTRVLSTDRVWRELSIGIEVEIIR